jgi:hypothetical protein
MPDVRAAVPGWFHQTDEILNQLLEENIVFPERVIRINQ